MQIAQELYDPIRLMLSEGTTPAKIGSVLGVPAAAIIELNRNEFHINLRVAFGHYLEKQGMPCRIGAGSQKTAVIFAGLLAESAELVVYGAEQRWPCPDYSLAVRLYAHAQVIPVLKEEFAQSFGLHMTPVGLTRDRHHLLPQIADVPLFAPFRWPTAEEIADSTACKTYESQAEYQELLVSEATDLRFVIDFHDINDLGEFFLPLLEVVPDALEGIPIGLRHKPEYPLWRDEVMKTYILTLGGEVQATEILDQPIH